jgi:L-ascorbate metabolism protein UlaG (beta-lactamase superfamily)
VLPVGGIRIFGRRLDMNPNEAAAAVKILKPSRVIPSHYGLTGPFPFVFSSSEPASEFSKLVQAKVPATQVIVLQPGESWHYYR